MYAVQEPTKGGEQTFVASVPGPHGPGTFISGINRSDPGQLKTLAYHNGIRMPPHGFRFADPTDRWKIRALRPEKAIASLLCCPHSDKIVTKNM